MSAFRVPPPTSPVVRPLRERNGAPRHVDEQQVALVRAATRELIGPLLEQHRDELRAVREIAQRMEAGYNNLAQRLEAFVIGEEEVAVAAVVDGASDELPNLARFKAEATVVYRLTAKDIGKALGDISFSTISYLLGRTGLNWTAARPALWHHELHRMTNRRLWHPDVVGLFAEVILNLEHPERAGLSAACVRRMDAIRPSVERAMKTVS